jgi:hypothetical protein
MADLVYDRPRGNCSICQQEIIWVMGEKNKHHWRHLPGTNQNHIPGGESTEHRYSKKFLAWFLNNGGKIIFQHDCPRCCTKISVEEFNRPSSQANVEVTFGNVIFDVASCANDLDFGIEVWHRHKTDNIEGRDKTRWYEISTEEIMPLFNESSNPLPKTITLTDRKNNKPCDGPNCFTMKFLAEKLCYYAEQAPYACEARRVVDMASRGSYLTATEFWYTTGWSDVDGFEKPDKKYWDIFLQRKRCMRCEQHCPEVKYYKPYCNQCYIKTKKEDGGTEEHRIDISPGLKNYLRSKFSWLDAVPGNWSVGTPCHFCRKNYIDDDGPQKYWEPGLNYLKCYVWWFGDKKCCCTACLEYRCVGIIDQDIQRKN